MPGIDSLRRPVEQGNGYVNGLGQAATVAYRCRTDVGDSDGAGLSRDVGKFLAVSAWQRNRAALHSDLQDNRNTWTAGLAVLSVRNPGNRDATGPPGDDDNDDAQTADQYR